MASNNHAQASEASQAYERLLVGMARMLYEYIHTTSNVEALRLLDESKVFDEFLAEWDKHPWEYPIDYLDDFTMNLGEWLVLKMSMLKPTKRQLREQTQVTPGVIEKFAKDVQGVLESLEIILLT